MPVPQPPDPASGLYQLLGVDREASAADIAHAYRRKARDAHPDSRPRDADAPARFRALAEAYQVLSDPVRRAAYDRSCRPDTTARQGRPVPGPPLEAGPARVDPPLWAGPARVDPPLWAGPARVDPPLWAGPARVDPPLWAGPARVDPPLWASPVRVAPPAGEPAPDAGGDGQFRRALFAALVVRYLGERRDEPW